MAWTNSKISTAFVRDCMNNVAAFTLNTDTVEAALYDNTITPDQTVASASFAYNAGVWNAGHVLDAAGWPSIGRPLVGQTSTFATNVYTFTASATVSANSFTSLTNATGVLTYDHTLAAPVADQGMCFNYLGGQQTIFAGTFTVAWSGSGIFAFTV